MIPSPKGTTQMEPISAKIRFLRLRENMPPVMARIPGSAKVMNTSQRRAWVTPVGVPKPTENPMRMRMSNATKKTR
jgi:hypothetical protein